MSTIEVKVPDIGDFTDVPVIEVFVKPGDTVKAEDSLVTLESDKATMDVPAPIAGVVKELKVKLGDKVSEGSVILTLDAAGAGAPTAKAAPAAAAAAPTAVAPATAPRAGSGERVRRGRRCGDRVKVPDIGDFKDVPIIEVFVKAGDAVKAEDSLVSLESEKATMDVPAPSAGVVKELKVKLGDKVSEGSVILLLEASGGAAAPSGVAAPAPTAPRPTPRHPPPAHQHLPRTCPCTFAPAATGGKATAPAVGTTSIDATSFKNAHASPSVRAFARELGVDLSKVKGSGPKDRILEEDVQKFVKSVMSGATSAPTAASPGAGG